jgi:hypothetical protein
MDFVHLKLITIKFEFSFLLAQSDHIFPVQIKQSLWNNIHYCFSIARSYISGNRPQLLSK